MKWMISSLLSFVLLATPAAAAWEGELHAFWQAAEAYGVEEGVEPTVGFTGLVEQGARQLSGLVGEGLATVSRLLAVVLLCSVAWNVRGQGKSGLQAVEVAGALAITALTMTDIDSMIGLGREAVGRMEVFSQILLPTMAVLTAAGGGITSAAVRQGATVLFSRCLIALMDKLLIPLVYAYVAVGCAQAAVGNPGLQRLADMIKSMVTVLLTAILLAFVGYLTASGAVAGSADLSKVKAVRMAISRAIPVVGGILADASESVLAGAGILKGTVGAAGMLVVLAICLTPFLHLAVHYLMYKAAAALCGLVAQPGLSKLIDTVGSAFGLILGMTGAAALLLMVSLVSAITAVTG